LNCIAEFIPHPEIAPNKEAYDQELYHFKISMLGQEIYAPGIEKHPLFKYKTWYKHDYLQIFRDIKAKILPEKETFAELIRTDLFFIAYFVANWDDGKSSGNKPFIVEKCRIIEDGPETGTVDIWSREHGKSTCITISRTVKRIVNDPECTTAIFSYKAGAAAAFLDSIRKILELPIMKWAFPDICWDNTNDATSWSLQGGIRVKRKNTVRREHTVQAFGLVEGMPTGGHWDHLIFDDVETDDMAQNPDQLELCFEKLQMAYNLGREGGTACIIGTFYSHHGVLTRLQAMKDISGDLMYLVRIYPGTDDGTINGKPVFFSQEYLNGKKTRPGFSTQILCNPTPAHSAKLKYENIKEIKRRDLPESRLKIVIIDPAGDKDVQTGSKNDSWAMLCLGVKPVMDEMGLSEVYIEDAIAGEMGSAESTDAACTIYCRNGRVDILGVERVGTDSAWLHVKNALAAKGRYLEVKKPGKFGGNLVLLAPANRSKNKKVSDNLEWPLNNSKIHICEDLPDKIKDAIKNEMEKFPFFHVDILDALAYVYDILGDPTMQFRLPKKKIEKKKESYTSPGSA
jgi:hypothetical protein